jgi:two-component system NtrC family sensor kinase
MQLIKNISKLPHNLVMRLLIGGTTLAVSLGAYYSYQAVRNVMLESLKKNAFLEVRQGRDDIDRWLANLKVHVETLANTAPVKSMKWSIAEPYLKGEVLRVDDIYGLAIAQPNGWRYVTISKPTNISDRAYFQKAMAGQTNVSDPVIGRAVKIPTIAVATPVRQALDTTSAPNGEIHSLVRLDRISQVLDTVKYGENSYAFALDSQGGVIAHPNPSLVPNSKNLAPKLVQSSDQNLAAIARRMVNQEQGIELLPIDGTQKYVAYLPLNEAHWSVGLVIPRENIESQLRSLDIIALAVAGLASTMLVMLWQVQTLEQKHLKKSNEVLENRVTERTAVLSSTLEQLQQSQLRLIQSEKMSALGSLVAGVAHEINNPVNFIYGNVTHADEYVQELLKLLQLYQEHYPNPHPEVSLCADAIDIDFLAEDLPKLLASMRIGADRIRQIVLSLRNFSRLDQAEVKPVDIHEGIDSTLLILQHRLKASSDRAAVEVIKNYGDLPLIECYAGQLNQVFMNIFTNAIDALEEREKHPNESSGKPSPSQIQITTQRYGADHIRVCIVDNGGGMPKEVQQRIFDPFFTTKPVGKGTGMGMSISYQIIHEKHHGLIWCESTPTMGTTFWIEIPIQQATPPLPLSAEENHPTPIK